MRRDDRLRAAATSPEEKAQQALEMMDLGVELQRTKLRVADPLASDAEIEQRLRAWLARAT